MKSDDVIVEAALEGEEPKVKELIAEYQACTPLDGSWDQLSTNDEIRYARWAGQTSDGKKNDAAYLAATGKPAFPWPGSSDTRIFMADEVINEQGSGLYVAFRRAMAAAKMSLGESGQRFGLALLDHWMNPLVMEGFIDELRLSAQYWGAYGKMFLHPRWAREVQLERRVLKLAEIVALLDAAAAAGIGLPEIKNEELRIKNGEADQSLLTSAATLMNGQEFAGLLQAATEDKEVMRVCMGIVKVVQGLYAKQQMAGDEVDLPPLSDATLREAVRDLAEEGQATIPCPYVCRDELEILCLKPFEEVTVRGNCTDLRRARVFRRVFLDEVSLRRKIVEEGWDKGWVEAALKHKGKVSSWGTSSVNQGSTQVDPTKFADGRAFTMMTLPGHESAGDVECVYGYYWALDRDNVPGVFVTVFHPEVGRSDGATERQSEGGGKGYAVHGLAEEGLIPFVLGRREVLSRQLLDSRGIPQIANGWQREKKVHRDAAVDLASIGVIPPINKYANSVQGNYRFGPAVQNTVQRGMEPKFMDVPKSGDRLAHELCDRVDADKRRYFGLMGDDVPLAVSEMRQQEQADAFLMAWTLAFGMGLRLAQVNMRDDEFARITGAPAGWLEERRSDRRLFAAVLEFDVRELNPEFVLKQAEAINQAVVPGDVAGVVNRAKLTQALFHAISPRLAREAIVPETEASQQMFDRVNADVALMFLGNLPRLVESDPSARIKLQYLDQVLQGNPNYVAAITAGMAAAEAQGEGSSTTEAQSAQSGGGGGNPAVRFAQLVQLYRQNLQHSLDQEKNKEIGRIGVDPSKMQAA